jgi:hypothetical protein
MLSKLAKSYLGATIPVVNINGVIRPETYRASYSAPMQS